MRISVSIDDDVAQRAREIASKRGTTLSELVRDYLNDLAAANTSPGTRRDEREALERSFRQFQFWVGRKSWNREQSHERS
ncbi:MAG TPA: DUF6364 family protein [Terriglobales bacterium]